MDPETKRRFEAEMWRLYEEPKKAGYNATYYLRTLNELGGLATARKLLASPAPAQGLARLYELGLLESSVERLVLRPEWRSLFSSEERATARQRLEAYGWKGS